LTSVKQCQRELIAEFKASGVTAEKVLADLEHTRLLALTKEDYATATRCAELQGKYIAMFTDKQQSNVTVSEERKREIEKLFSCSIAGE
jgi:roadblock/LC7 domain-containing protein